MSAKRNALIGVAAIAVLGLNVLACSSQSSSNTTAPPPTLSVSSASPSSGEQGALSLAVTIAGEGFTSGATARFFKTGTTDPTGIVVQSTSYVSATQLVATIDIGGTATIAQFDVQVQLTNGRSASGTGRFSVTAKRIDPCTQTPAPASTAYLAGQPGHPGYFDSTFGAGTGRVLAPTDFYASTSHSDVVTQTIAGEKRIVVVGSSMSSCAGSSSTAQWVIARYLPDGTLDPTFGTGGVVRKSLGEGAHLESVAVQPDNKIVVVGWTFFSAVPNPPTVGRLNEDGSLDTTFGTDGVVMLATQENGGFHAVAIQSDGKIVAVGYVEHRLAANDNYIVRLQPNGEVDTSFAPESGQGASFRSVRLQRIGSEERPVVVGYVFPVLGTADAAVFRFTSSGARDTSFGGTGIVQISFQEPGYVGRYWDTFSDVVIDSSNRIVAAGSSETCPTTCPGERRDLALARLDEAGRLDPTFGVGGRLRFPTSQPTATGSGIAVQDDGRILVAGYSYDSTTADYGNVHNWRAGLWRFNGDGTRDTTFGPQGDGEALDPILDAKRTAYWRGLVLLPGGRIVCAGTVVTESDPGVSYEVLGRFWQ